MAHTSCTSTGNVRVSPTGRTVQWSSTFSSSSWPAAGSSPISSRNSVPLSAARSRPGVDSTAPVNEPFRWPNSVVCTRSPARPAQLHSTNGRAAARRRVVMKIAGDQVLAGAGVAEDQDRARAARGGRGQVGLVELGAQAPDLLAVADDLRRVAAALALQARPVLLQLAVALLARQEEPERVAERRRVPAQERDVGGRVAGGARPRLEVEDRERRARPGIGHGRAQHGVRPAGERARLGRVAAVELRVLDELRLHRLDRAADARRADAGDALPGQARLHLAEREAARADALELERLRVLHAQQERLLGAERARRVRERLGERGGGVARGAEDLERARERAQQVLAPLGRRVEDAFGFAFGHRGASTVAAARARKQRRNARRSASQK